MSPGSRPVEVEGAGTQAGCQDGTRLHVCHIVSGDRWAGAEAQVAALLKYLHRHRDLLLSAMVLNAGRLADEIRGLGIQVDVIPEQHHTLRSALHHAEIILSGKSVQILHSHRYKENLLAALLARRCRVPIVVRTQHGLPEPLQGFRRAKQTLIQLADHCVARWATDRIISVSLEMTETLARRIPRTSIQTIPNGVDLETVQSRFSKSEAQARLSLPLNAKVIGTAGRLEPVKRLDLFLEMARRIRDRRSDVRFLIAGEGREEEPLRALAARLGIEKEMLFLGHRNDVYDVLRAFDMMVLTSDHEGLPMVLLEAMALGALIVARSVGGIPEAIQSGLSGVLVNSGDAAALAEACLRALDGTDDSRRMTEAARKLAQERFSSERTAGEVRWLYHSLLKRS